MFFFEYLAIIKANIIVFYLFKFRYLKLEPLKTLNINIYFFIYILKELVFFSIIEKANISIFYKSYIY
jgi:hypothetical protein